MMKDLENIAKDLESGDLSLDESVKKFEEAYSALMEANIMIYHDGVGIWTFEEFDFD